MNGGFVKTAGVSTILSTHPLYGSRARSCPYLEGREERTILAELDGANAQDLYDEAIRSGFRRSHNFVYRPACPQCTACQPVRVDTLRFSPRRSMNRVINANRDIRAVIGQPETTSEQYNLFFSYQKRRHPGGGMDNMSFDEYRFMMENSPVATFAAEFRDPDDALLGVMLADEAGDGLSAVYSFFDPEKKRRTLGTHMILWLINQCRERNRRYLYLGYRIAGFAKMNYKMRFQPLETLGPDGWEPLVDNSGSNDRQAG